MVSAIELERAAEYTARVYLPTVREARRVELVIAELVEHFRQKGDFSEAARIEEAVTRATKALPRPRVDPSRAATFCQKLARDPSADLAAP